MPGPHQSPPDAVPAAPASPTAHPAEAELRAALARSHAQCQSLQRRAEQAEAAQRDSLALLCDLDRELEAQLDALGTASAVLDAAGQLLRRSRSFASLPGMAGVPPMAAAATWAPALGWNEAADDLPRARALGQVHRLVSVPGGGLHQLRIARWPGTGANPGGASAALEAMGRPQFCITVLDLGQLQGRRQLQQVLDTMPANIAAIDVGGRIHMVNARWAAFARANSALSEAQADAQFGVGINYLDALRRAAAASEDAARSLAGLEDVLAGRTARFCQPYPCHSPDARRWFVLEAARLSHPVPGALLCHIDVTPWQNLPMLAAGIRHT